MALPTSRKDIKNGDRVKIFGLKSVAFNGLVGVVTGRKEQKKGLNVMHCLFVKLDPPPLNAKKSLYLFYVGNVAKIDDIAPETLDIHGSTRGVLKRNRAPKKEAASSSSNGINSLKIPAKKSKLSYGTSLQNDKRTGTWGHEDNAADGHTSKRSKTSLDIPTTNSMPHKLIRKPVTTNGASTPIQKRSPPKRSLKHSKQELPASLTGATAQPLNPSLQQSSPTLARTSRAVPEPSRKPPTLPPKRAISHAQQIMKNRPKLFVNCPTRPTKLKLPFKLKPPSKKRKLISERSFRTTNTGVSDKTIPVCFRLMNEKREIILSHCKDCVRDFNNSWYSWKCYVNSLFPELGTKKYRGEHYGEWIDDIDDWIDMVDYWENDPDRDAHLEIDIAIKSKKKPECLSSSASTPRSKSTNSSTGQKRPHQSPSNCPTSGLRNPENKSHANGDKVNTTARGHNTFHILSLASDAVMNEGCLTRESLFHSLKQSQDIPLHEVDKILTTDPHWRPVECLEMCLCLTQSQHYIFNA